MSRRSIVNRVFNVTFKSNGPQDLYHSGQTKAILVQYKKGSEFFVVLHHMDCKRQSWEVFRCA